MNMHNIKWADAFQNRALSLELAYTLINNTPPNRYIHGFDDRNTIDMENIDLDLIKKNYPKAIITYKNIVTDKTTSCEEDKSRPQPHPIDDEEEDFGDPEIYVMGQYQTAGLVIYDQTIIYDVDPSGIEIYYNDDDPIKLYKKLVGLFKFKKYVPTSSQIELVCFNNEYYTVTSKIKNTNINIEENYNDDFKQTFDNIIRFLKDRSSGLIILRGEKGTGKTTLIRHLISNYPNKYILITNAMAEHLSSPEFMSFMLEHRNCVFILEDCEQILMKRSENMFTGAIANILNMSDGLMSDIFNVKFICTFNADVSKIDDALLRKGRCFANYEFKPLCKEKTKNLLEKQGVKLEEYKPMTLADIYNYNSEDFEENKNEQKQFGF